MAVIFNAFSAGNPAMLQRQDTPAHALAEQIRQQFPSAQISMDIPPHPQASCFVDIKLEHKLVVVEWRKGKGFGISCAPALYLGEGPHEVYETEEAARTRIISLMLSDIYTQGAEPTAEESTIGEQRRRHLARRTNRRLGISRPRH